MSEPLQVLFVCTANICRSPYLELTARAMAGDSTAVAFSSAGTHGFVDQPMNDAMAQTLPPDAATEFRSRPVDRRILEATDLVLTAEASHRSYILEEFPAMFRKIYTVGQFADAIEAHPGLTGRDLVAAVGARRTAPRPEHDIADPYRRGMQAAQNASGTMSTMLMNIVPRLVGQDPAGQTP